VAGVIGEYSVTGVPPSLCGNTPPKSVGGAAKAPKDPLKEENCGFVATESER
jgi:hypothetical protein